MRTRRTRLFGAIAAIAAACSGPPAPDAAICRDVIHRLCRPARCAEVTATLEVGDTCEFALLARTGCQSDDFAFPDALPRERVLECRLALLRRGLDPEQHPGCEDVD